MDLTPGEIKKLDTVVINRIAAGEIIQRPANALKEMIENSLDAKSTNIQVTVKDGGLKLLQIQDNGTGIRREDFNILCERFTTSKLRKFEDLEAISTYGFRGEALSSISHVAHLTVTSKTATSQCAFSAYYVDGTMSADVKPIAGNQGTIITVEDLFYNMSVRRGALRSPAEEYAKVADVVGKYAVHNSEVGFSVKKQGDSIDIRTMQGSNVVDNIRIVYGQAIAKELVEFTLEDDAFKFKVSGQISNVNYTSKKMQFVLFINHRLVDCQSLKRRIDQIYTTYLPKNGHPFVYLSLQIDPHNVDVNVHPTKHEVHFLNEDQIVDMIGTALEAKLLDGNHSRTFYAQAKLPVNILHTTKHDSSVNGDKTMNKTIYDKDLVRTDTKEQKLEKFFGPAISKDDMEMKEVLKLTQNFEEHILEKTILSPDGEPNVLESENSNTKSDKIANDVIRNNGIKSTKKSFANNFTVQKRRIQVCLRSVLDMQAAIENDCDAALREIFAEHVFVGAVSCHQALIQHGIRLLLIDTEQLMKELFYQCIVFNFQNFKAFQFESPLSIKELVLIALDQPETDWSEEDGDKDELANNAVAILIEKCEMLKTYFEVDINSAGMVCTIPVLIDGHIPCLAGLPKYILRLACEVTWDEERSCFESFARETANYYAESETENSDDWKYTVEYVFYSFIKEYFLPPSEFKSNGVVLEAANLPKLYKVFERC